MCEDCRVEMKLSQALAHGFGSSRGLLSWDQLFGLGGKTLSDVTVAVIDLGVSSFVSSLAMDPHQF